MVRNKDNDDLIADSDMKSALSGDSDLADVSVKSYAPATLTLDSDDDNSDLGIGSARGMTASMYKAAEDAQALIIEKGYSVVDLVGYLVKERHFPLQAAEIIIDYALDHSFKSISRSANMNQLRLQASAKYRRALESGKEGAIAAALARLIKLQEMDDEYNLKCAELDSTLARKKISRTAISRSGLGDGKISIEIHEMSESQKSLAEKPILRKALKNLPESRTEVIDSDHASSDLEGSDYDGYNPEDS